MQKPLRITYRHVEASAALEACIREHFANLEPCCEHIVDCHVSVELPSARRRTGVPFEVNIDLTIAGRQIAVHSGRADRVAHMDVHAALRDTFATLRRLLEDYVPYSALTDSEATPDPAST